MKLAMKEAINAKEIADEEVKSITKKLKDATIELEELQKTDKVTLINLYRNLAVYLLHSNNDKASY